MTHTNTKPKVQNLDILAWEEISRMSSLAMLTVTATAWYIYITKPVGGDMLAFVVFPVLAFLNHGWIRFLNLVRFKNSIRRWLMAVWIAFWLVITLQVLVQPDQAFHPLERLFSPVACLFSQEGNLDPFWHAVIILFLLWSTITVSRLSVDSGTVMRQLEFCLVALLGLGLIQIEPSIQSTIIPLYLALLFGLIAVSTARITGVAEERGGRLPALSWQWGASIFLAALGTVLLGLGVGWIFDHQLGNILVGLALALLILLIIVAGIVVLPFLLIISGFVTNLRGEFQKALESVQLIAQEPGDAILDVVPATIRTPGFVETVRPYFLIGLLVLGLIFILYRAGLLDWILPHRSGEIGEGLGGIKGKAQARDDLERKRRRARPGQLLAAARIRQVYFQLLKTADNLGKPRPPAITPLEFLPTLEGLFPSRAEDLMEITQAYTKIRYGMYPESTDEVDAVERAWKSIQQEARKLMVAKRKTRQPAK